MKIVSIPRNERGEIDYERFNALFHLAATQGDVEIPVSKDFDFGEWRRVAIAHERDRQLLVQVSEPTRWWDVFAQLDRFEKWIVVMVVVSIIRIVVRLAR